MTAKFDAFKAELIALCDKHGVQLSTSMYDSIEVRNRIPFSTGAGDEAIYLDCIEDATGDTEDAEAAAR